MNTGINGSSIFNMLSDLFLLPFHCCVFFEILLVNRTVRMEGYSEDYCVLLSLLVPSEIDSSPKNTKNSFRKQSQRMLPMRQWNVCCLVLVFVNVLPSQFPLKKMLVFSS